MDRRIYLPFLLAIPLVPLAYFLILEARVAFAFGFPLDDAWIFWVFAKNLATGQGFTFNPGQPVLGTTSILWVFVLSSSYLMTHHVVFISKFWGVIFFLLTIPLTYKICLFYTEQKKIAFLGTLTFALAPPMIFGALSGMEISLATFLLCLTLFFHLKERGKNQKIFLAPIFGALCFMARPELILLYPLLLTHNYLGMSDKGKRAEASHKSVIFRKALTFVTFLTPSFVLSYLVTGNLFPNTFAAKTLDSGLIWAIRNGNLNELFISLTLNPFVWVGAMLATLVFLNIFWAFFWSQGLILSSLKRDTFIYPLVFLLIPMVRGMVAPVGNPFSGEHRYVSFLFPLLAIFFVIGWRGLNQAESNRLSNGSLRKWLLLIMGVAVILAFIFYLNPLVKKDVILSLFSKYYFPFPQAWPSLVAGNFCDFQVIFWFVLIFIGGVGFLSSTKFFTQLPSGRKTVFLLLIAGMVLQIGFFINRAQRYALSVKNINDMQVHLGKWMDQNISEGSLVAINDVGAIKLFGKRECLDLEGLVSPQIIPYKILGRESYVLYLNRNRPDYFIIFPTWYPTLARVLALEKRILYQIKLEDNVACGGGGYMIVAKPDWEFFDSTFQNSGILDFKPYIPKKSFKRRWYDDQEHQGFLPDWRVYQVKGEEAERRRSFKEAEKFYQKAESYEPQQEWFYLLMAIFYQNKGDQAQAAREYQKSIRYRLFPPPDFVPKKRR
jgi:hypothetical protein